MSAQTFDPLKPPPEVFQPKPPAEVPPEKDFRKDDDTVTIDVGDRKLVLKAMRWGKLSRCYPLIAEMRKLDKQIIDLLRLEQDVEDDIAIMNFQQRLDIIIKVLCIAEGNISYDAIADELTLEQAQKLPGAFNKLLQVSGFEVASAGEALGLETSKDRVKGSTETSAPSSPSSSPSVSKEVAGTA